MAVNEPERLGDLELAVLNVLWKATGPLEVREVVSALPEERAYTTVMTTLSRLHGKGYLSQHRDGRSFTYAPTVSRSEVLQGMFRRIADKLFGGDLYELIALILGAERPLTDAQRRRLHELVERIDDDTDESSHD